MFRLLVPPKFDRFPVGIGEVCGLMANGHDFRENFGGKPRSVPALGRDWPPASSSLGAHATVVGVRFAGPLRCAAEGSLGNSVEAEGRRVGDCP